MVSFELIKSILKILYFLLFLFIPGFYFLKILNRKYFNNNISILLSCPTSIFIFGLLFLLLQILSSPPIIYSVLIGGFITSLLLIAYKKGLINELFRISRIYHYAILLILIGAIINVCFVSIGNESANDISSWEHSRNIADRGLHTLPGDNYAPYQTATVFIKNSKPWVTKNWTMGDRPPLMGVINCIWSHFTLNSENYSFWNYEIVGIVLNILFILPCTIISSRFFRDPHVYYIVPIAILLNTFVFLNIYYTWPKLMEAFFILLIIALFMNKRIGYLSMSIAGILAGMGLLSHGLAILSLPILLTLSMIVLFKLKSLKHLVPFIGFILLLQSPWIAYKKLHPSINTNHLLYHYIPTEKYPDDPIRTLTNFFKKVPIKEQLEHRCELIKKVVSNNMNRAFKSLLTGRVIGYYKRTEMREFLFPIVAIGEFQILFCIPVLSYLTICYFLLKRKEAFLNFNFKLIALFFSFIILSYLFNAFIKWDISTNHTLPYAELIIGISIISGISFSLLKPIRILSFSLIVAHFCYYVIRSAQRQGFQIFDFYNLSIIVGIIILFYVSRNFVRRDPRSKLKREAVQQIL
ncbi:MAG: hypothetical protein JSV96_17060 [Candidatus Aminicenantes bacterium]|nr:MAG: hypothetical protein JSV96_17060 [Candidatus Aminicenantes bacterium]